MEYKNEGYLVIIQNGFEGHHGDLEALDFVRVFATLEDVVDVIAASFDSVGLECHRCSFMVLKQGDSFGDFMRFPVGKYHKATDFFIGFDAKYYDEKWYKKHDMYDKIERMIEDRVEAIRAERKAEVEKMKREFKEKKEKDKAERERSE